MKILWATDFSPRANGAGAVAGELARLTGGSVEVVHVLPPRTTDILALAADAVLLDEAAVASLQARAAAEAQALKAAGANATSWLGEGDVASGLLQRAADTGAELIVLAGKARTPFGRLLLGSGADRLIRRADRPVLIVPEGVTSLGSGEGLRVLAAVDGGAGTGAVVDFVRTLRQQAACDVTFLRLYWPPEEYRRLGLQGARDYVTADPEVVADLQRHLTGQVGVLPGRGRVSLAVEPTWGEPGCRIVDLARERQAGLLVLGAESRHGLGAVSHVPVAGHVARHAAGVPVLFVPVRPRAADATALPRVMTVLAGTDLSAEANRAVPFAYTLLAGRGGVVELCYVHERPIADPPYAYEVSQGRLTGVERAALEARLRALIPRQAEALGITTHVVVVDGGKAGVALVQAGERLWADAIVVGSRGRGGVARALLGSVADQVVRHAGRPVFVVPPARES